MVQSNFFSLEVSTFVKRASMPMSTMSYRLTGLSAFKMSDPEGTLKMTLLLIIPASCTISFQCNHQLLLDLYIDPVSVAGSWVCHLSRDIMRR